MHGAARSIPAAAEEELGGDWAGQPRPKVDDTSVPPLCLETLYREESPRLLRSLARRTASRDDARDLVHDIFCRIARLGAAGPLRLDRPQAYLGRIATNLLRDRAKQASRRMSASHVPADEGTLPGLDQQRLLESRDMLTRVEAAMLKLRPKTREIFMAHRIDGQVTPKSRNVWDSR